MRFEAEVFQPDLEANFGDSLESDALEVNEILPGAVWPDVIAHGAGVKTKLVNREAPNELEKVLIDFARREISRVAREVLNEITCAKQQVEFCEEERINGGADRRYFEALHMIFADLDWKIRGLKAINGPFGSGSCFGWELLGFSDVLWPIWEAENFFDTLVRRDIVPECVFEDLFTALAPVTQIFTGSRYER